jgi:RNA polymerase sigma-70 factor (ECF subfamily)
MSSQARTIIEIIVRENYGKLLAILIHQFKEIELCEDSLQEAILVALERWAPHELPANPPAWLLLTAKRRVIDRLRRLKNFDNKTNELVLLDDIERDLHDLEADIDNMQIPDERLRLIFTCCHPALEEQVRVALTLKTLCGFDTRQVANAFVTSESTMAQRLVRARHKIKKAGIPYQVPPTSLLEERLSAVLAVIYFIFNEGYFGSTGDALISTELCTEAIQLAAILIELMPKEIEIVGLFALMLFHHSRYDARVNERGDLIDLENQDRSLWKSELITRADKLLKSALLKGRPGPYQIQAAISAVHAHTKSFAQTDWKQIVLLYRRLETFDKNPVIKLNLAVALSYAEDPQTGLLYLDFLGAIPQLSGYYPFHAARAAMLSRLGKSLEAEESYQAAIALCNNQAEKRYLESRLQLNCAS